MFNTSTTLINWPKLRILLLLGNTAKWDDDNERRGSGMEGVNNKGDATPDHQADDGASDTAGSVLQLLVVEFKMWLNLHFTPHNVSTSQGHFYKVHCTCSLTVSGNLSLLKISSYIRSKTTDEVPSVLYFQRLNKL